VVVKSTTLEVMLKEMSNGAICSLSTSRFLMRKSMPSTFPFFFVMLAPALSTVSMHAATACARSTASAAPGGYRARFTPPAATACLPATRDGPAASTRAACLCCVAAC
jgi:hypothetical protein